jgi:hypothetical protein
MAAPEAEYVIEISVPSFGDNGVQRLHSRTREPDPTPEPELEPSDLGRFEPSPYDLGITDDPEVMWADLREPEPEAEAGL